MRYLYLLTLTFLLSGVNGWAQPANDLCEGAIQIPMAGPGICIPFAGDNTDATSSAITPGCANYQGFEVWYKFIVPSTGLAVIETLAQDGGFGDSGLAAYSGTCGDLTLLSCDDDGGEGAFSYIELAGLTPGETIYLAVWEYGGNDTIMFNICAHQPPPCPDILPGSLTVSSCDPNSMDVNWEASSDESTYFIEYGEEGFELGTGTIVSGATGVDGPPVNISGLTAGMSYTFYVHEQCGVDNYNTPDVVATAATAPGVLANDDCLNAIQLPIGNVMTCTPTLGFNNCATDGGIAPGCASYLGGEVWFSFVVPATGDVWLETTGSGGIGDTGMGLYSGSCDALELVSCNDDGGEGLYSLITTVGLNPGETYYVAVWEYGNNSFGTFNICAYQAPTCITPATTSFSVDPITLTEATINWDASLLPGATYIIEYGDLGFIPGTGTTITGVIGVDGPPVLIENLNPSSNYSYYWQVACSANDGDSTNVLGPFTFETLSPPPANDNLCDASPITVDAPVVYFNNEGGTSESGEPVPDCWLLLGQFESIWMSFVAPAEGTATVTTDFADTELSDPHIAVYQLTGDCSDMTALVEVGCDEDGGVIGIGYQSIVNLTGLTPGATYYIQLDGYFDVDGEFGIQVLTQPLGIDELIFEGFNVFPNPAKDEININSSAFTGKVTVEIFDLEGRTVLSETKVLNANETSPLSIESLNPGAYMIRITGNAGSSVMRLIIE